MGMKMKFQRRTRFLSPQLEGMEK